MAVTGEEVTIAVEDNGIGISPSDQAHIFDRFFRADPSRSQVEGSGLGLAIAKWIADTHGARISVDSKEGTGSIFQIIFLLLRGGVRSPQTGLSLASVAR
jgi:signal transduction histidine kinase